MSESLGISITSSCTVYVSGVDSSQGKQGIFYTFYVLSSLTSFQSLPPMWVLTGLSLREWDERSLNLFEFVFMNVFQQLRLSKISLGQIFWVVFLSPCFIYFPHQHFYVPYLSSLSSLPLWILHLECEFSKTFAFLRVSLKDQTTFSLKIMKIFMAKRLVIGRCRGRISN